MMEVIPINTNENTASKADLWADRIHTFRESGLSRKDWCQKNGIPLLDPKDSVKGFGDGMYF